MLSSYIKESNNKKTALKVSVFNVYVLDSNREPKAPSLMVAVFPKVILFLIYFYMQNLFFIFLNRQEYGGET
jgi:hypothetical protein